MTTYSAPLRDIRFVLHELLDIGQFGGVAPFEAAAPSSTAAASASPSSTTSKDR